MIRVCEAKNPFSCASTYNFHECRWLVSLTCFNWSPQLVDLHSVGLMTLCITKISLIGAFQALVRGTVVRTEGFWVPG